MAYQSSHTGQVIDEAVNTINDFNMSQLRDFFYPIGSIYTSTKSTSPATLFGGTWTQIKDTFLLTAGNTYSAGTTGGSATHTHTSAAHTHEIPSHKHSLSDDGWGYLSMGGNGVIKMIYSYNSGSWTGNWQITGSSSKESTASGGDGMVLGGYTDSTNITASSTTPGNTGSSSNLPPYKVVYAWERTA